MDKIKTHVYLATSRHDPVVIHLLSDENIPRLSENSFFQIMIETNREFSIGTHLWLGDFRFPVELIGRDEANVFRYVAVIENIFTFSEREKFSAVINTSHGPKRLHKLFLNYFGKCNIELEVPAYEKEDYIPLGSVDVYSDKIREINGLLEYLFEKDFYFWNIVSLTKAVAHEEDRLSENVFWKLCSVREICNMFQGEFLGQISFSKITKLIPAHHLVRWKEYEVISDASILWYVENANALSLTTISDENHFLLLNKPYKSDVVYSESLEESTDVYENQLIHWFINDVYSFLQETKTVVRKKYEQYVFKEDLLKYGIYSSFFKRMLTFTVELEGAVEQIKAGLNEHIPVSVEHVDGIQDQRLHNKPHYRNAYLALIKWLENRQVNYYPDVLFSGLKDVSKLYEVYCLFKIFDALINDLHFLPSVNSPINESNSLQFDPFSAADIEMLSIYEFARGEVTIRLHYDSLPASLTTVAANIGSRGLRPDFVFEVKVDGVLSYYIMDAKYKTLSNIENYDYNELTLKYLHGVASAQGGYLNAHGLFILNPIADGGVRYYHRQAYSLTGQFPALPAIGRVEVSVDKDHKGALSRVLEQLISVSRRMA